MKNLLIISCILITGLSSLGAQVQFDIKFGVSRGTSPNSAPIIVNRHNPFEEFLFNMVQTKPQFYGGINAHLQLSAPFFLEGGFSYTKRTSVYQINHRMATEGKPQEEFLSGSEQLILLPVNVGVSIGKVDITSGLTAMRSISPSKALVSLQGFHQDDSTFKMGWQMGARYGFKRVMAGIEYQGTLNRVCQGMYVNDQSLEVMNVPGNLVFSIQYRLL